MKRELKYVRLISDRPVPGTSSDSIMAVKLVNLENHRLQPLIDIFRDKDIGVDQQNSCLLLAGPKSRLSECITSIRSYDGEHALSHEMQDLMEVTDPGCRSYWMFKDHRVDLDAKTHLMGVLNVTPDSFSDGGRFLDPRVAVNHALKMVEAGADIIDVGGESTRPGAEATTLDEELSRVIPVIELLKRESDVKISIDTYKSGVAMKAVEAGADIINDISALGHDPAIAEVAATHNTGLVLMHIKGRPKDMQIEPNYTDVMEEIIRYLYYRKALALSKGVQENQIVVDPGIGFGKRWFDNYDIINRLQELRILGSPILVGASRKSFLRKATMPDPSQRLEGTLASHVLAIMNGARIVRVHDVREASQAARVTDLFRQRMERQGIIDMELS